MENKYFLGYKGIFRGLLERKVFLRGKFFCSLLFSFIITFLFSFVLRHSTIQYNDFLIFSVVGMFVYLFLFGFSFIIFVHVIHVMDSFWIVSLSKESEKGKITVFEQYISMFGFVSFLCGIALVFYFFSSVILFLLRPFSTPIITEIAYIFSNKVTFIFSVISFVVFLFSFFSLYSLFYFVDAVSSFYSLSRFKQIKLVSEYDSEGSFETEDIGDIGKDIE